MKMRISFVGLTRFRFVAAASLTAAWLIASSQPVAAQPRVVELVADKDSRFKIAGQKAGQLVVKTGETIILRIDARKGKTWNRDGTVHGFTLLHMKSRTKVAGWDLDLQPGVQEFTLTAPEPGEYEVVCTVICSDSHEGMRMKVLVLP
jgi:heme/copper-type cytochrome/quinol oxidase subunit 2